MGKRKTEEVSIGRVDIGIEGDARFGVSVGCRCLGGGEADEGKEGCELHLGGPGTDGEERR